jgi:ribose/xylose/arabinose/galactoside ABC-type transport system permease subunit
MLSRGRALVVELGKVLLGLGLLLAAVGGVMLLAGRAGLPLGRLPGDFAWRGKKAQVFFPLGTSILISVVLTLLFYLLSKLRK